MPRKPREQPAKPDTPPPPEQPKATEEEKTGKPAEERQAARRPSQTQQPSQQARVVEGQVPQIELYVPEPISTDELGKLNIYQRWNAMIGEMGIIPKRGWNDHHHYWFTTDADLNAFVGPLLRKYHLIVMPHVLHDQIQRFETAGKQYVTRVPMLIVVINADQPDERMEIPWAGEGGDTVDKGLYKGFTGGLKYFWMKTLQVATGDDPETFARTDQLADMAAQAASSGGQRPQQRDPEIRSSNRRQPEKGGRQQDVTEVQIRQVKAMTKVLGGIRATASMCDQLFDTSIYDSIDGMDNAEEAWAALVNYLRAQGGQSVGKLLYEMGQEQARRVKANEEAPRDPTANVVTDGSPEAAEQVARQVETAPPGFVPADEEMGGGYPG